MKRTVALFLLAVFVYHQCSYAQSVSIPASAEEECSIEFAFSGAYLEDEMDKQLFCNGVKRANEVVKTVQSVSNSAVSVPIVFLLDADRTYDEGSFTLSGWVKSSFVSDRASEAMLAHEYGHAMFHYDVLKKSSSDEVKKFVKYYETAFEYGQSTLARSTWMKLVPRPLNV